MVSLSTWIGAIMALIRAIPEILRLINTITAANKKARAEKEWEDFEKKFKDEKSNPK
jgi:hypothetical protein